MLCLALLRILYLILICIHNKLERNKNKFKDLCNINWIFLRFVARNATVKFI